MQDAVALLPIVAIALLFWLLIVRPASRRQAKMRDLQNSLQVGSDVLLAAGLYGTVVSVADDRVGLEVADGVVVYAAKAAIVQILDGPVDADTYDDTDDEADDDLSGDVDLTKGASDVETPGTEGGRR